MDGVIRRLVTTGCGMPPDADLLRNNNPQVRSKSRGISMM